MKILTLNTHSWLEEQQAEKTDRLVEKIVTEDYDLIALQEVNQRVGGERAVLDDWYCLNEDNDRFPILVDNFAKVLAERLQIADCDYYWTWAFSHIGYEVFEEGLALFSKTPLLSTCTRVSACDDFADARRRILLSAVTEHQGQLYTFASAHHSWWENGAFQIEWQQAEAYLKQSPYPIILAGDFNQIAGTKGHDLILASELKLQDAYLAAEVKIGAATIEGPIAGWEEVAEALRIDYVFFTDAWVAKKYEVVFEGQREPLVSDHFGVAVELLLNKKCLEKS